MTEIEAGGRGAGRVPITLACSECKARNYKTTRSATDVTGTCALPEGTKMVMPGDNITMTIELHTPVGLEEQMRFAIREGGRTVGAGIVTKVLE